MSARHYMNNPFPDNHNGFDYSPKSESDEVAEERQQMQESQNRASEKKLLNMLTSIFK